MIISVVLFLSFVPFAYYKFLELKGTDEGRKRGPVETAMAGLMLLATIGLLLSVLGIMRGVDEMYPWLFAGSLVSYIGLGTVVEFLLLQDPPKMEAQIKARKYFCLLIFISVSVFAMVLVQYHREQQRQVNMQVEIDAEQAIHKAVSKRSESSEAPAAKPAPTAEAGGSSDAGVKTAPAAP